MAGVTQHQQILVVVDESNTAYSIKSILEENHFKTDVFTDPFLALSEFQKNPDNYRLLIYDSTTKSMTAFEFIKKTRLENRGIKILLITTIRITLAEFRKVLPSIHIDGFMGKQSFADEIIPLVNEAFKSHAS
ncbi:MAG: response regulator [Candidatus Nitrosotenuis sp.]|nr:MAG: response regulator [Candidatus Nitrosotenuis sp.]